MSPSQNYDTLVRQQEGCVLHPYKDQAGIATIGIGTTRYPTGVSVTMQDPPITQDQADEYLQYDTKDAAGAVNAHVTSAINQNQFDALCDFTYNEGTGALQVSTLLKLVNANPSDPSIRGAFAVWNKIHVNGQLVVLDDLVNRRKAEADLYFS